MSSRRETAHTYIGISCFFFCMYYIRGLCYFGTYASPENAINSEENENGTSKSDNRTLIFGQFDATIEEKRKGAMYTMAKLKT